MDVNEYEKERNLFDKWDEYVNSTEGSLVNFLTAFAPWLAPLAPAYMTFVHMREFLEFPVLIAFALSLLVEILGFGTVSTALDFWFHNRNDTAKKKRAPIEVVVGVFVFYLGLILVSNVVIDIANAYFGDNVQKGAIILVRALLTLQTIPGALIVAVRTGHRDLLREIKEEKARKEEESSKKVSKNEEIYEGKDEKLSSDWRKVLPKLSIDQLKELARLSPDQIRVYAQEAGLTYKTISNWKNRAIGELARIEEEQQEQSNEQESTQ